MAWTQSDPASAVAWALVELGPPAATAMKMTSSGMPWSRHARAHHVESDSGLPVTLKPTIHVDSYHNARYRNYRKPRPKMLLVAEGMRHCIHVNGCLGSCLRNLRQLQGQTKVSAPVWHDYALHLRFIHSCRWPLDFPVSFLLTSDLQPKNMAAYMVL